MWFVSPGWRRWVAERGRGESWGVEASSLRKQSISSDIVLFILFILFSPISYQSSVRRYYPYWLSSQGQKKNQPTFGSDGLSTSSDRSFFSRSRSWISWTVTQQHVQIVHGKKQLCVSLYHVKKLHDNWYCTFFLSLSDLSLSLLTERPDWTM